MRDKDRHLRAKVRKCGKCAKHTLRMVARDKDGAELWRCSNCHYELRPNKLGEWDDNPKN
jgi:ribosomal protein L37AE/L43A